MQIIFRQTDALFLRYRGYLLDSEIHENVVQTLMIDHLCGESLSEPSPEQIIGAMSSLLRPKHSSI